MACDVLLVEDDPNIRQSLAATLTDLGFSVQIAHHGLQAVRMIPTVQPKVVLLDLLMPYMNGWQVIENVASQPELRDIPVVVMTASTSPRPPGCYRLLKKPVSMDELDAVLRPIVDRANAVDGSSKQVA